MSVTDLDTLLDQLKDPSHYVRVPSRNVFDEHSERDKKGKVVRRFTRKELAWLARVNNERAQKGDLTPLTYGHTDPDEQDETKQPPHRGYAMNYHVAYDKRHAKWMLRADYYFPRHEFSTAVKYPFTSIELWPSDGLIVPISLLRRAPQRPLGQWIYQKGSSTRDSTASNPDNPIGVGSWSYARGGQVLRYSMSASWLNTQKGGHMAVKKSKSYGMPPEEDMHDDSTHTEPDGDEGLDAGGEGEDGLQTAPSHEKMHAYFQHMHAHPYAKEIHEHYAKHYGMDDMDDPEEGEEHDPTDLPDADEEMPDQHGAFATGSATNEHPSMNKKKGKAGTSRYKKGGEQQQYKRRISELEEREAQLAAENWLLQLENEQLQLDDDDETGDLANLVTAYKKGGDEACRRYANKVRENRRERIDKPLGRVDSSDIRRSSSRFDIEENPEAMPVEDQNKVMAYKKEHQLWDLPFAELAARALPHKYGRKPASNSNRNGTSRQGE